MRVGWQLKIQIKYLQKQPHSQYGCNIFVRRYIFADIPLFSLYPNLGPPPQLFILRNSYRCFRLLIIYNQTLVECSVFASSLTLTEKNADEENTKCMNIYKTFCKTSAFEKIPMEKSPHKCDCKQRSTINKNADL